MSKKSEEHMDISSNEIKLSFGPKVEAAVKCKPRQIEKAQDAGHFKLIVLLLGCSIIAALFFSVFGWGNPLKSLRLAGSLLFGMELENGASPSKMINYLLSYVLPMNVGIAVTGSVLALAGAAYQGVFKNPMASPDILGATAGGSLGGGIYILLFSMVEDPLKISIASETRDTFMANIGRQLFIFLFGFLSVVAIMAIGVLIDRGFKSTSTMVLAGMIVSSMFNSILGYIRYIITMMDPNDERLPMLNMFLMGNFLNVAQVPNFIKLLVPCLIFSVPLLLMRYQINGLVFGDEEAQAMGINIKVLRTGIIFCATILTTTTIATVGQIGWVGLVIPHMGRLLAGPDFKRLMPVSMLLGALFLLLAQAVSNLGHLPVGVYTSILGIPVFFYFLISSRKKGKKLWN
ncbi:hemin transport system permease protein HmuU [Ruminiclostridium hungatei]|uniref:Hemin transport system permease protein HmuU n=1 Tax=Ruminiclostridium hungatei TaxID=48256 RepID=A0A1V4SGE5_RUMHU|nr:iron ABC transporter permease [Ruminiclostridium hungatei]OPX42803.1 hemin transport system permease protein HmuU [Ruminiclostridium hungatei]